MFTLVLRDTSALFVNHPLFPQCICNEIVPDNPLEVVMWIFYSLSLAKLPIFICLTSMLHSCTTLVRSPPFRFRKFLTVLLNDVKPVIHSVAHALLSLVSGTGPYNNNHSAVSISFCLTFLNERNSCHLKKICTMFGSKEKDKNVKCLQTDKQVAYRRTTNNRRLEKII